MADADEEVAEAVDPRAPCIICNKMSSSQWLWADVRDHSKGSVWGGRDGGQVHLSMLRGWAHRRKPAPSVRCAVGARLRRRLHVSLQCVRAESPSAHRELKASRGVVLGGLHGC